MLDNKTEVSCERGGRQVRGASLCGGNSGEWRRIARGSLVVALLLGGGMVGCGGSDDSGGSDSGVSPTPPPASQLSAVDGFSVVRPGVATRVDLSTYVRGSGATLASISSDRADCSATNVSGLSVDITSESGLCEFSYKVSGQGAGASATLNTLASTLASPVLPPLSQTMTLAEPNKTFDLMALLGADWPVGYNLDPASLLVQGGSAQGTVTASGNVLTYTPPSSTEPVWNQILFVLKDPARPGEDAMGALYITVADSVNQPPVIGEPKYDYQAQTGNTIVTMQTATLDLGTLANLNITEPDGDEWQLVEVQSYSASVAPVDPNSVTNKQFTFQAGVPGDHIVSYIVGDHEAGFSMGLISINVGAAEVPKTWNNITIGEKIFQATPLYSEVINRGVMAEAVYDDVVANYVAGVNDTAAESYCSNGNHWATLEELELLRTTPAADIERLKYPVERTYVTYDVDRQLLTYALNTGATAPYDSATSPTQYVMCVAQPSMSYISHVTAYGTDTAISDGVWWPLGTLTSEGGSSDPVVTASANFGSTPLTEANVQLDPPGCAQGTCRVKLKGDDVTTYGNVTVQVANATVPGKTINIGPLTLLQNAKLFDASKQIDNSPANGSTANTILVSFTDGRGQYLPDTAVKLQYTAPMNVNVSPASCTNAVNCTPVTTDSNGNILLSLTSTMEGSYAINFKADAVVGGMPGTAYNVVSTFKTLLAPNFELGCTLGKVTVPANGLTYTCPLTKAEADALGIVYNDVVNAGFGFDYVLFDHARGNVYCNSMGYRMATIEELGLLYSTYGNMTTYAGWPDVWFTRSSTVSDLDQIWGLNLTTGESSESLSTTVQSLSVSCVR
ncbi:Ig-like domain-containing protein [Aeromonas sp. sif2416]|uniref:Ig-like domain-containing protein n=1 Tax=Aeromonas sp. sif2416 TaxID=2854793 RepID=UPI001C4492EB|nr:Ig-like domain-containing protein [Aeromonas sp. sif2416]MBV7439409.1 Ig-like domain-containing protein [Aeromonas sp. sif2416]